jgi:hypothetical protein
MSQVKEKIFYDSPPEKAWFLTFEALYIKNRDHRRILNRQPEMKVIEGRLCFFLTKSELMN